MSTFWYALAIHYIQQGKKNTYAKNELRMIVPRSGLLQFVTNKPKWMFQLLQQNKLTPLKTGSKTSTNALLILRKLFQFNNHSNQN